MGCLYMLTSPSGKSYIGITSKTADARWAKHREHAIGKRDAGALYGAMRKYGPESFTVKTLVIGAWEYLCELEKAAIKAFGTMAPGGYNISAGGEGAPGRFVSDKERAAHSVAQKKRFQRPEERARLQIQLEKAHEANRKKWEGKPRWKKQPVENPISKEERSRLIKAAMQRPESRQRMLAAARARAADPAWRAKVSASKTGAKLPPATAEARKNHSEAAKRMWIRRKQEQHVQET